MARGRPPIDTRTEADKPLKWEQHFINDDGTKCVWKYDMNITRYGPYECTTFYPSNYKTPSEKIKDANKKLPKSQQTFLNPKTGRLVSRNRAIQLGLIK